MEKKILLFVIFKFRVENVFINIAFHVGLRIKQFKANSYAGNVIQQLKSC